MAFTINPGKAAPSVDSSLPSQAQLSARERAIAMLVGQTPPVNQSAVKAEEIPAVAAPKVEAEAPAKEVSPANSEASSETKPAEATTSKEEPLSTQYAILARKEKALRAKALQQEQALKAKEAALLAREEAIKAKDSEYQSKYISKDMIQKNPLQVLADLGFSAEQITSLALNSPSQESLAHKAELETLKAEIRSLREESTGVKKSIEQRDTEAEKQVLSQFKRETEMLIDADPEFETIKATDSVQDVVDLIKKTFKEDGILLTVEEACKEVETHLVEEASKLAKLSKLQKLFGSKPAEAAKPIVSDQGKQQPQVKTLTNSISASKPLNARERAILAFKGELK